MPAARAGILLLAAVALTSFASFACGTRDDAPSEAAATDLEDETACARTPAAPNRERKVVVSHPYTVDDGGGMSANGTLFEVLALSRSGTLTKTGATFHMGAAASTPIVFTPDGRIGLVAQTDAENHGTIGVFRFDAHGAVHVVHASFRGPFEASRVVMDPSGRRAFVLDSNTPHNHGGIYEVAIGCDGTLTNRGLVIGGTAEALQFLPNEPTKAVWYAAFPRGAAGGNDTYLLDVRGPRVNVLATGTTFADGKAIPSTLAITKDGKYALVDDAAFEAGNRLAVVSLPDLRLVDTLATPNPADIAMSPFGNAALVLNTMGTDAIRVLSYDPASAATPFADKGPIAYQHGAPQLPVNVVGIAVGELEGEMFVSENVAVRQVRFAPDGTASDVGLVSFGDGARPSELVGVVGVQP